MNFTYLAVQTHLTPSYRLFSTQDATLVCCFGAPSLRGIGRHPSMPSAWIGFMRSNLLTSTVNSFTDVTIKSNRTGNIPRRLRGIVSITSLCAHKLYVSKRYALCCVSLLMRRATHNNCRTAISVVGFYCPLDLNRTATIWRGILVR